MTRKSTKRALLSSVLALVVCIAMLIGTTFAWFTDNVSSTNNIIKSGNLDVELEYSTDMSTWTPVGANTNVFTNNLWEPGHTEVVYLRVSNKGSLALKYKLGVNVVNEITSETEKGALIKLSDIILFGIVDDVTAKFAQREDAIAALTTSTKVSAGYDSGEKVLEKTNDSHTVAMVVYMPTSVGNEANHATGKAAPQIDLGLNVVATQQTAESDSFGTTYDALATYPIVKSVNFVHKSTPKTIDAGEVSVTVPYYAETGSYELKVANRSEEINEDGETVLGFDIELYKDGEKIDTPTSGVEYPVKIYVGKNRIIAGVNHNGEAVADYSYDFTTGYVSFTTSSFSPFEVVFEKVTGAFPLETVEDINTAVAAGGTYKISADLTVEKTVKIPEGTNVTLDITDCTITSAKKLFSVAKGATLTVTGNGTVTSTAASYDSFIFDNEGTLNVVGGTYIIDNANTYAHVVSSGKGATTNLTNATFKTNGKYGVIGNGIGGTPMPTMTINNCVIIQESEGDAAIENYGHLYITSSTVTGGDIRYDEPIVNSHVAGASVTVDSGLFTAIGGEIFNEGNYTYNITGGTYNIDPSALLNDGYVAKLVDGKYVVVPADVKEATKVEDIKETVNAGGDVIITEDVTGSADKGGYSVAGVTQTNGGVIDGNGNTLEVTNANSTWDCALYTNGGTIKNLTIKGAFRGIFTAGLNQDLIVDNVTIDDVCYTFSADGADPNYEVVFKNSTINGWTSYTSGFKAVSFTNCNFGKGTGGYKYAYCRPYNDTTFTNCVFEEGYEFDAGRAKSTFINCYYGDTLITQDNVAELLGSSAAAVVVK